MTFYLHTSTSSKKAAQAHKRSCSDITSITHCLNVLSSLAENTPSTNTTPDEHHFCGYASVTGVRDNHNDIILKGAFSQTIATWKKKGKFPPVLWQHHYDDPAVAYLTQMHEDDKGLWVKGTFFTNFPLAQMAYQAVKSGATNALSIGFRILKSRMTQEGREISLADVHEISFATLPGNENALIHECKTLAPITLPPPRPHPIPPSLHPEELVYTLGLISP